MNLTFESTFTVLPKHCNWHIPMIFGGQFMSELDLAASAVCDRLLRDEGSPCDRAVTYEFSGRFLGAAECGDIIFLKAEIVELRLKGMGVEVVAEREHRSTPGRERIAEAKFVFVSKQGDKYLNHGLQMPSF